MDPKLLSRRSFIKKTTVLAVGVSATTLFTGLVQAGTGAYGYYCVHQKVKVFNEQGAFTHHLCYFEGANDECSSMTPTICGMALKPDPLTGIMGYALASCAFHKSPATAEKCTPIPGDTPV